MDVGRLALGRQERENRHVSGIPAAHDLITNLAPGVTPLLERQRPAMASFTAAFDGSWGDPNLLLRVGVANLMTCVFGDIVKSKFKGDAILWNRKSGRQIADHL